MMRVRFPPPAPSLMFERCFAHVAQLVEHTLGKGEVSGSTPLMSSIVKIKADMYISAFLVCAYKIKCAQSEGGSNG